MTGEITIRRAAEADAEDIAELIALTSAACCFTPERPCPDWYRESIRPERILTLLREPQAACLLAVRNGVPAGVLFIVDRTQVKYFFTRPDLQRSGIGQRLWQCALRGGMLGLQVTVRASLNAVAAYRRLGFQASDMAGAFAGLHYQAMTIDLAAEVRPEDA